jgi:Holin of 3TMs, for gene-transfer release
MADDFSPPPGVPAEEIIVAPLSNPQQPVIAPAPLSDPQQPVIAPAPLSDPQLDPQQPNIAPVNVSTSNVIINNPDNAVVQDVDDGPVTASSIAFDHKMAERKQRLAEAQFRLEEKKTIHDMKMEVKRENFSEAQQKVESENLAGAPGEHWLQAFWRPMMGWLYMIICLMDFVIFPLAAMIMPVIYKGFGYNLNYTAWQSLTLQNGGIIHLAFGAILGVSALSRGWEKQAGATLSKVTAK